MMRKSQSLTKSPLKPRGRPWVTPHLQNSLKIGELSRRSGVPIVTLRFFEGVGILRRIRNAETRNTKHRRYERFAVQELTLVHSLRASGFSIPEVRSILKALRGFRHPSKTNLSALRRTIDVVRTRRNELAKIEKMLVARQGEPALSLEEFYREYAESIA